MAYRATLQRLFPFTEGAGVPTDLIFGFPSTLINGPAWGTNAFGPCIVCSDVAHQIFVGQEGVNLTLPTTGGGTALLIRRKTDATLRNSVGFGVDDGTDATRFGAHMPFGDSEAYWDFGGQTNGSTRVHAAYSVGTAVERWAFSQGPAFGKIYLGGTKLVTGTSQGTRSASTLNLLLNHGHAFNGDLQEINYFAILSEQMSDADVAAWAAAADPTAYFVLGSGVSPLLTTLRPSQAQRGE
jgi:hypothetical protein